MPCGIVMLCRIRMLCRIMIIDIFASGSTISGHMVKRMVQADSAHQLDLKPILNAFLIVDW